MQTGLATFCCSVWYSGFSDLLPEMVLNGLPPFPYYIWLQSLTPQFASWPQVSVSNTSVGTFPFKVTMIRLSFVRLCWPTFGGHRSCLIMNVMFSRRKYDNFLQPQYDWLTWLLHNAITQMRRLHDNIDQVAHIKTNKQLRIDHHYHIRLFRVWWGLG